jgi:hypothetical protein
MCAATYAGTRQALILAELLLGGYIALPRVSHWRPTVAVSSRLVEAPRPWPRAVTMSNTSLIKRATR